MRGHSPGSVSRCVLVGPPMRVVARGPATDGKQQRHRVRRLPGGQWGPGPGSSPHEVHEGHGVPVCLSQLLPPLTPAIPQASHSCLLVRLVIFFQGNPKPRRLISFAHNCLCLRFTYMSCGTTFSMRNKTTHLGPKCSGGGQVKHRYGACPRCNSELRRLVLPRRGGLPRLRLR